MADVIGDLAAQGTGVGSDRQSGAQRAAFGGLKGEWTVVTSKIDGPQSAPTERIGCVLKSPYQRMRWCVVLPASVTGCTVHVGRWIEATGKGVTVSQFAEEREVSITRTTILDQEIGREPVMVWVDGFTGDPNEAVHILYQPTGNNPL